MLAHPPFRRIIRSFRRLHIAAFAVVPILLLLALALVGGGLRILEQAQEKVSLDFFALTTYLDSQGRFLRNLQSRNHELNTFPSLPPPVHSEVIPTPGGRPYAYLVHPSLADTPYAVFCFDASNCPPHDTAGHTIATQLYAIGDYLSDSYATHWSHSYFPGVTTLLTDAPPTFSIMVPASRLTNKDKPYSPAALSSVIDAVQAQIQPDMASLRWIRVPDLPETMAGVIDVSFPRGIWPSSHAIHEAIPRVYAITTFDLRRTTLFRNISETPIYDGFWLRHGSEAPLIGSGPAPGSGSAGTHFTFNGVVLTLLDASQTWTGIYRISYLTLLQAKPWLPGMALLLLLASLAAIIAYTRWYNRRVIEPAQMAQMALLRATAEADDANAAKSRFLAAVSHEIRTPLYGILGTLELFSMAPLGDGQRRHLDRLQQSSTLLLQLINDILDTTKIEANQLALNTEPFNPRQLVQFCADSYAAAALHKKLLLFACIDTDIPACVEGDINRIRQIINNFLSNALKFTPSGQIVARLRSERCGEQAYTLTFQVVDSGIGITAADQHKLFTPFYQATNSPQTSQGTGLGLSICASLAELMGGEIRVTSEPGLGSSFALVVTLPVAESFTLSTPPDLSGLNILIRSPHAELSDNLCQWLRQWGATTAPVSSATPQAGSSNDLLIDVLTPGGRQNRPPGWDAHYIVSGLSPEQPMDASAFIEGYSAEDLALGVLRYLNRHLGKPHPDRRTAPHLNLRLLVAEDNPINQAVLRDQLIQLGCTATVVADGREALSHWGAGKFDAVLTDVNMPHMNGYELARSLRQLGAVIPIIGVTANAMRDEEAHCKAAGMSAWIVKPITLETLRQCLIRLLPGSPATKAASSSGEAHHHAQMHQSIQELAHIPEKYHELFRASMMTDADALAVAARSQDAPAMQHMLHRMQGALLTMKQRTLAERIKSAQDMLKYEPLTLASDASLGIAKDIKALIAQHLP